MTSKYTISSLDYASEDPVEPPAYLISATLGNRGTHWKTRALRIALHR
jgi:hypothetical protein